MIPRVKLRKALGDPELLGSVLVGPSWKAWRTTLIASMGERLTKSERALFKQLTGREREPGQRVEEFVGVIGRRGGKSRAISVLATYIAGLCEHPALVPGETGVVLCIASDMEQASIVFGYIVACFDGSPILRQLVDSRTADTLRLTNGIEVQVRSASFRRLRGPTYIAIVGDEIAFWMTADSSSNPDAEILNAIRPGLATTGGPLFLISSPYARKGELWRNFDKHFGRNGDPLILVAQGASRTFNPSLRQSIVDRAYERDAASANAEYGAIFRTDVETFVRVEAVQACVSKGVYERPPQSDKTYYGFCDPSGGSVDAMTLAIGHLDYGKQTVIIDALYERRPPFSPEQVCRDFSDLLRRYRISSIVGDKYGGVWCAEQFGRFGILYKASAAPKSDLYRDFLPLVNSARVELLDHPRMIQQLVALERRASRTSKDVIDHPPGGFDDLINAVAGVSAQQGKYGAYDPTFRGWNDGDDPNDAEACRQWRQARFNAFILSGGRVR